MADLANTKSPSPEAHVTSLTNSFSRKNSQQLSNGMINSISRNDNNLVNSLDNYGANKSGTESYDAQDIRDKKREVYRFETDWLVSTLAWSNEPGESLQLALCSYMENYTNQVQLVKLAKDANDQQLQSTLSFDHPYPATKILWIPNVAEGNQTYPRLIATTADYLRLWRIKETESGDNSVGESIDGCQLEVNLECLLNSNQGSKVCAPLTSLDWNEIDPRMIVTSSVDTTCAVWDIETAALMGTIEKPLDAIRLRSQLVAHDHQVYDVSFSRYGSGRDVFVSCSGDGSVRLFDLRRLSTSSVLYEIDKSQKLLDRRALLRCSCSKQNANLVSTFAINSNEIIIIDIRKPGKPMTKLANHTGNLNGMSWAPHSSHHLCSAADDGQALIWDLTKLPNPIDEPILAYSAGGKINTINWSTSQPDWIAIGFQDCLELLRV